MPDFPRVTMNDIVDNIVHSEIVMHQSKSGQILRWCVLTTKSGYSVTGKPSCAVSPENDNVTQGEKIAYDNALNEMWPLMGYALKEKISQEK